MKAGVVNNQDSHPAAHRRASGSLRSFSDAQAIRSRTVGSLKTLRDRTGTGGILDLSAIRLQHGTESAYAERPLLSDRVLNAALLVKHRADAADAYLVPTRRPWTTKVVIPFDPRDLSLGGRYLLVGQRDWEETLHAVASRPGCVPEDAKVLAAIDELPSLDPFLVREHLVRRGFTAAACYFKIAPRDLGALLTWVCKSIQPLVERAYPGATRQSIGRIAEGLLAYEGDDRLAPLRATLRLEDGEDCDRAMFAWRGFLYYKWQQRSLRPELERLAEQLPLVRPIGASDPQLRARARTSPRLLLYTMQRERAVVSAELAGYDRAFAELVSGANPTSFRAFLLKDAPRFLGLGKRLGALSNLCAFWKGRFPTGVDLVAPVSEIADLTREFETNTAAEFCAEAWEEEPGFPAEPRSFAPYFV